MRVSPIKSDTIVLDDDPHVWIPHNFAQFISELDHIGGLSEDRLLVYRGQADHRWLLESTFARTCKRILLDIDSPMRPAKNILESVEYNQALFSLLLLKFDLLVRPPDELVRLDTTLGIDSMFEHLKDLQQYPRKDRCLLKGTFFMDWSTDWEVALFFTNHDADEHSMRPRENDGAVLICDASAAGKTLMRDEKEEPEAIKVKDIIQRMVQAQNAGHAFGCPLLFHPPRQRNHRRADRQGAVYWAQMDLRYDLEYIWTLQERQPDRDDLIYVKLVSPYAARQDAERYLAERGKTHAWLFPG